VFEIILSSSECQIALGFSAELLISSCLFFGGDGFCSHGSSVVRFSQKAILTDEPSFSKYFMLNLIVKRETRNLISVDLYGPIYAENMKGVPKAS
jgi:hypothetical protein